MTGDTRNFLLITLNYWAFTLTDGAIRMLVVLYFHQLGYSALEIAYLFIFYEVFGILTNLFGGWLGAWLGLNTTMYLGMSLQVLALLLLGSPEAWLSVPFVMAVQALSGIGKDLNKMSAKASVKLFAKNSSGGLFKWVAALTGSKNALKGVGFFLGGALLGGLGFRNAVWLLAAMLGLVLVGTAAMIPSGLGKMSYKPKFRQFFAKTKALNLLSCARFFLFGARDVWFVVALPVFLVTQLHFSDTLAGSFLASWVIGYGFVQALAPKILKAKAPPDGRTAWLLAGLLALVPLGIYSLMNTTTSTASLTWILLPGLVLFGIVFALNSAVHSFLVLVYADDEKLSMDVGFYYMSNAAGRLLGTLCSGWFFVLGGLKACLLISALFLALASAISLALPRNAEQSH